jgi:group I intron endonuclease
MFIYITTNLINDRYYIGMCNHIENGNYLGSGKLIKQAIKKYGRKNFKREILQECKTFEELCKAEKYWIKQYDAVNDENSYNLDSGGRGVSSEYMKEYWSSFTPEEKKTARNWAQYWLGKDNPLVGQEVSIATRKKIGAKSVNRNWYRGPRPEQCGENNPNAKEYSVVIHGKEIFCGCLKEYSNVSGISYRILKNIVHYGTVRSENSKYKDFFIFKIE